MKLRITMRITLDKYKILKIILFDKILTVIFKKIGQIVIPANFIVLT